MAYKSDKWICAALLVLCTLPAMAGAAEVLGTRPAHLQRDVSAVANDQAITRRIWAPGIDDGYVPQGVAWADGALYLSAYRSTDPKIGTGPCRIFKIDPDSGRTLGQFDLPADCGHAGGLAFAGDKVLVVADGRRLYRIDVAAAFTPGASARAVTATVALRGRLKASFVDVDGAALFIGAYEKEGTPAWGHFLPLSLLDTHNGKTVGDAAALGVIALPAHAQGAAFDTAGTLWITASNSRMGALYQWDRTTGLPLKRFPMAAGIEDIAFDAQGRLWSVSEAGSLRWQAWATRFPLLFAVDPTRLAPGP